MSLNLCVYSSKSVLLNLDRNGSPHTLKATNAMSTIAYVQISQHHTFSEN